MKSLVTLFALFSVSSAYAACPNLEGRWRCESSKNEFSSIVISQEAITGGALYKIVNQNGTTFTYPADGVIHHVEDEDSIGTVEVTCVSSTEVHSVQQKRARDHSLSAIAVEDIALTNSDEMHSSGKYHMEYMGQVRDSEVQSVCHKMN